MRGNRIILQIENLQKTFPLKGGFFTRNKGFVDAVSNVSFDLTKGETIGLVGESGCGKTTVGLCILRIIEHAKGKVLFEGKDVFTMDKKELKDFRRKAQIIFQDPFGSLDPQWKVENIVGEGLDVHGIARGTEREDRIITILKKVGMEPEHKNRYPHEFSGGQRQRIGIARALILEPELVIGDEPLSALDVSIQAQIINLLTELQREFQFSYLIISHDLSVVKYVSDHIAVMYLGKIVEIAKSNDIYYSSKHPYTIALLSAIPLADPRVNRQRIILRGEIPSPITPPKGCRFNTRCPEKFDRCERKEPVLIKVGPSHYCACHLHVNL